MEHETEDDVGGTLDIKVVGDTEAIRDVNTPEVSVDWFVPANGIKA